MSKAHAIEDLHGRLKANVESIQQLNQQVSNRNPALVAMFWAFSYPAQTPPLSGPGEAGVGGVGP